MLEESLFRDERRERQISSNRLHLLLLLILVAMAGLALRYHYLQIEQFERFSTLSEDNRVHVRAVAPTRGLIFDRNGVVLAENQPSYSLTLVPEHVQDMQQTLQLIGDAIELSPADLERFENQLQAPRRPFEPVLLRSKLNEEEVARIAVQEFLLLGVDIKVDLIRHYPFDDYFSHVVGYVGRINDREQAQLDRELYAGTHVIGKTGIERNYQSDLLGSVGYEYVETDARGNVLRVLEREHPQPGENIWLNLDSRLQVAVQDALGDERGAVVALDVQTGDVLALVSNPGFDANLFVSGISTSDYNELLHNIDKPLFNRALQGQYPPGSTVKPLFGLIGLQEGAVTPSFSMHDPGIFYLEGQERPFRDWKPEGHGEVDMLVAIAASCDTYFYELGYRTGIDALSSYGYRFGLGHVTGIDLPGEEEGIMPSRIWKQGARSEPWYPGDTINASIGQGFMLATPLQLAQVAVTLARRGDVISPQVANRVGDNPVPMPVVDHIQANPENWDLVTEGMRLVMHGEHGTARATGNLANNYQMAGKSATAQVISVAQGVDYDDLELEKHLRDHALFIAFAPVDNPQIAVSVIVENAESGSSEAAPIAKLVFDSWFAHHPEALQQQTQVTHAP